MSQYSDAELCELESIYLASLSPEMSRAYRDSLDTGHIFPTGHKSTPKPRPVSCGPDDRSRTLSLVPPVSSGDAGTDKWIVLATTTDDERAIAEFDFQADAKTLLRGEWQPIATAPTDGTPVKVYAAAYEDLPGFQTVAAYHPDGGWCVCELRTVTHWQPLGPDPI